MEKPYNGTHMVYLATKYGGYVQGPETSINSNYDPRVRDWYKKVCSRKSR